MKDINFWIGTGVGFISALLGAAVVAWIQYKFKIKEYNYTREQAKKDRDEEELARKEAARQEYMAMITDLRPDLIDGVDWDRFVERHRKYYPNNRVLGYLSERGYFGRPALSERDLQGMSLTELRNLYMLLFNMPINSTLLDIFDTREQELKRTTEELWEVLSRMRATFKQSDIQNPQKE